MITVTGSDTVNVTQVTLFDVSGTREINGTLQVSYTLLLIHRKKLNLMFCIV